MKKVYMCSFLSENIMWVENYRWKCKATMADFWFGVVIWKKLEDAKTWERQWMTPSNFHGYLISTTSPIGTNLNKLWDQWCHALDDLWMTWNGPPENTFKGQQSNVVTYSLISKWIPLTNYSYLLNKSIYVKQCVCFNARTWNSFYNASSSFKGKRERVFNYCYIDIQRDSGEIFLWIA